jgi:hypothetical protein
MDSDNLHFRMKLYTCKDYLTWEKHNEIILIYKTFFIYLQLIGENLESNFKIILDFILIL